MAGLWEHQRVKLPKVIDAKTGGEVKVDEEKYRNQACQFCDIVTDSYDELWGHRWQFHNITAGNIARVFSYVDAMIAHAKKKEGFAHYVVSAVRAAYALGLCKSIAAEVTEDGSDAENVVLLFGEVGTSVVEEAEVCDVVRPAVDNAEENPIESDMEPQIMDDSEVESAWWEKCIMCNQQAGSQEEFLKHRSDNHLQLGFSGYVTDVVPESGNDKDCVVDEGQDGDITDNVEVKQGEGDIVPGRVDNVESLPRTEVGKNESESVTKSKTIADGSRHVIKELVMSLKRMGKLHLIFTSAPGTIIGWFATEYGISVEELRLKLKEVLETECVDEVKEKIPCEAVSKVPEPVLEVREEESVTTPAQQCQKRKVLMVLGPEKRRRLEKDQERKVILVSVDQERGDDVERDYDGQAILAQVELEGVEGEFENDSGLLGREVATSVGGGTEEDDEEMVDDSTEDVYDFDYEGYENGEEDVMLTAVAMNSSERTEEGAQKVREDVNIERLKETSDGITLTEEQEVLFAELNEIMEKFSGKNERGFQVLENVERCVRPGVKHACKSCGFYCIMSHLNSCKKNKFC